MIDMPGNTTSAISLPGASLLSEPLPPCDSGSPTADARSLIVSDIVPRTVAAFTSSGVPQLTSTWALPVSITVSCCAIVSRVYFALPPTGKLRFASVRGSFKSSSSATGNSRDAHEKGGAVARSPR